MVSFAILAVIMLNLTGMLNSLPKAYAQSQCTSTYVSKDTGAPSKGYYYTWIASGDTAEYGVTGVLTPSSWNYDGDTSGHEDLWVNIPIVSGWVQAGVGAGAFIGYSYSSTRYPYVEYQTPYSGYGVIVATGYPIPGGDKDIGEVYTQRMSGVNYVDYLGLYSPHWGTSLWTTVYVGTSASGTPSTAGETYYTVNGENCDLYNNTSKGLNETATVATSPPWNAWPCVGCGTGILYLDPPYQIYEYSSTSWNEYLIS